MKAAYAGPIPTDESAMTKLILLTDLHMVPEGHAIIGLDPYRRLEAGIDHINRYHADADRVVITGDLAHYGDEASYRRLKGLLDRLAPPLSITIGNHDQRPVFQSVFPEAACDANGFVQSVVDLSDCRLVILDSVALATYGDPHDHAGRLCPSRLAWLEDALAGAGGRPVLLFLHHPPHETGFSGMDAIRLADEAAFYAVVERHSAVRHIFAGHVHRTISGSHRGIAFSVFKSTVHQQPMPFDTPDTSLSVDEPAAYGIALVTREGVLVHTEDYEIAVRDNLRIA